MEARFLQLVRDVRVVQSVDFVAVEPAFAGTMTVTWELSRVDSGTRVDIRAENVPAGIGREEHAVGMTSSLANLAAFVEAGENT